MDAVTLIRVVGRDRDTGIFSGGTPDDRRKGLVGPARSEKSMSDGLGESQDRWRRPG
jgi:hypothetical protein